MGLKMNKTLALKWISCIYTFILTLIFFGLFLLAGVGFGALNNRGIIRNLDESKYYNKVYEVLYDRASRDVDATGFPRSVLNEVITLERVYFTGKSYHDAIMNSEDASLKTDKLREILDRNLRQYLKAKGVDDPEKLDMNLDQLVDTIEKDYKEAIHLPLLSSLMDYRIKYLKVIVYILPILIFIGAFLCYLLLRIYRNRYIHRGVRYITYAMLSGSVLISMMAGYLMLAKPYNIIAQPKYYQSFLNGYLNWSIAIFLYIGGLGSVLSLILMSMVSYLKNRMKK